MSASMKAAGDPDLGVLRAVLGYQLPLRPVPDRDSDPDKYLEWLSEQRSDTFGPNSTVDTPGQDFINTPILQAIRSQLLENVDLLLEAGANPNGSDIELQERYQALFLRFRPSIPSYVDMDGDIANRETLLRCMKLSQMAPLTEEELEERTCTVSPFWTFVSATRRDIFPGGDDMNSLVAAAHFSSTDIVDRLIEAGADASNWISRQAGEIAETPSASGLAISSPLHAAVEANNVKMIKHLLRRGFNPNFIPVSTPLACFTPLMGTLLCAESCNQDHAESSNRGTLAGSHFPQSFSLASYNALISHPSTQHIITTPILSCHTLHLATAHVSLPLFKHVLSSTHLSPSSISPTALGHTVLHIACLPPSVCYLKGSVAAIRSIHDTRSLEIPRMRRLSSSPIPGSFSEYADVGIIMNEEATRHFSAQTEFISFVLPFLGEIVAQQDIYGNTALHYLASHKFVNESALEILRATKDGNAALNQIRNRWGFTAKDLLGTEMTKEGAAESELLLEYERELRNFRKRIDEWWDERLAVQWSHQNQTLGENSVVKGGQRGRARGRGQQRHGGENGRTLTQINDFPYHARH